MADLQALRELCEWIQQPSGRETLAKLRENGITSVRAGELELRLGPAVPPSREVDEESPPTEREPSADDDERNALETLLHSSGADASVFLEASKRARARLFARSNA